MCLGHMCKINFFILSIKVYNLSFTRTYWQAFDMQMVLKTIFNIVLCITNLFLILDLALLIYNVFPIFLVDTLLILRRSSKCLLIRKKNGVKKHLKMYK